MLRNKILTPAARTLRSVIRIVRWHQAAIFRLQSWLKRAMPNLDEITVRLPKSNHSIKLNASGDFGKTLFLDGLLGYEGTTTRKWFEFCRQADVVMDIGAHLGVFSLLAADANSTSRVFAFEPQPTNFRFLCAHIESSGMRERITPFEAAISDHTGTDQLLLKGTSGSTLAKDFWADSATLSQAQVQTTTLDDWLLSNQVSLSPHSILKMDVETHEPAILRGAQKALSQEPAIFCEVLATFTEAELTELLPASRWKYFWIGPDGPVERRRIIGDPAWQYNNYLFLSPSSPFLSLLG